MAADQDSDDNAFRRIINAAPGPIADILLRAAGVPGHAETAVLIHTALLPA